MLKIQEKYLNERIAQGKHGVNNTVNLTPVNKKPDKVREIY